MFLYPAKRNKSNVKFLAQTEAQEVLKLSEGCKKKKERILTGSNVHGAREPLSTPAQLL